MSTLSMKTPKKEPKSKHRMVVISDTHCGSMTGLTPPEWFMKPFHEKTWEEYCQIMKLLQPIDTLVMNGDGIDIPSLKKHDFDHNTADPDLQCHMLATALDVAKARNLIVTSGTARHTGAGLEMERNALDKAKLLAIEAGRPYQTAAYAIKWDTQIHGKIFNFRHHINSRVSPMTRPGTCAVELVWNALNAARQKEDKAAYIVRSHVHYYTICGDAYGKGISTPGLQIPNARYADQVCTGSVDWGVVWFDIYPNGRISHDYEICPLDFTRPQRIKL